MTERKDRVCPVALAGSLDSRFRRLFQNPRRLVGPYLRQGMTVLDVGCGPGFFVVEIADLVGPSGRVIAADLQPEMLDRLRAKIRGTALERRITLHPCQPGRLGAPGPVDFVLAFWVLHELPDQGAFFREAREILAQEGRMLLVEPPLHVSRCEFEATIRLAESEGFAVEERPRILFNKTALLRPGAHA
ncbi:MAG: class I SAM-dependent methyltransferase [Thermoanaerobaculia bacterium]